MKYAPHAPSTDLPSHADDGISCPVCLHGNATSFASARDRLFGLAPGVFRLYRCSWCLSVFQHPMPGGSEIRGFYPGNYWWEEEQRGEGRGKRFVARLERAYREFVTLDHVRYLLTCARRSPGSGRLLLDVGCGSGTFLHLARQRGFTAHGMDLSPQAVSAARRQYGLDVRQGAIGGTAWGGSRFDFVTMFHVLEHLTDPRDALNFAAAHLNPGGSLIIQVPNADSLQAHLFGTRWYGLDVPRHTVNFTRKGLQHLLSATGFEGAVVSRFSLRDNPASLASSLIPALDPIGRSGRGLKTGAVSGAAAEAAYFGLVLAALPFAALESALGYGGTIWVQARPARSGARVVDR